MIEPRKLYASPAYQALSDKRKQAASAILLHGQAFSAACEAAGLNATRERRNVGLKYCLELFRPNRVAQATQTATGAELDIYERVRRVAWLLGDRTTPAPADFENVVWKIDHADPNLGADLSQFLKEHGVVELPGRPEALPAEQIAAYWKNYEAKHPQSDPMPAVTPKPAEPAATPQPATKEPDYRIHRPDGKCSSCGNSAPAGLTVCATCSEVSSRPGKCSSCGAKTNAGVGLCDNCAVHIEW